MFEIQTTVYFTSPWPGGPAERKGPLSLGFLDEDDSGVLVPSGVSFCNFNTSILSACGALKFVEKGKIYWLFDM